MIKDLFVRLTSRKFLLALGAFVTLCAQKQYVAASAVVAAYLGVQGVNDFRNAS